MSEEKKNKIKGNNKFESALKVNEGIEQPETVSKESVLKFKRKRRKLLTVEQYIEGIEAGNVTILGQAITLVESKHPKHQKIAGEIVGKSLIRTGNSIRIGITGVPGVGKSTFIESFGKQLTSLGHKIAVLAIDPSSERSGGSILGDKTRMEELSADPNAFIRPSPSAGSLGGVANKTRETLLLCEAAGYDVILIETVGVGQSETAVHSMVDFFLLLMLAGAGDELQGIKRGIMEMADAIAITKADGNNIDKAKLAKIEYQNALHLFPPSESGWIPKVQTCSSVSGQGLNKVWETISSYKNKHEEYIKIKRREQAKYWMYETINESLRNNFYQNKDLKTKIKIMEKMVKEENVSSFKAATTLLREYFDSMQKK